MLNNHMKPANGNIYIFCFLGPALIFAWDPHGFSREFIVPCFLLYFISVCVTTIRITMVIVFFSDWFIISMHLIRIEEEHCF